MFFPEEGSGNEGAAEQNLSTEETLERELSSVSGSEGPAEGGEKGEEAGKEEGGGGKEKEGSEGAAGKEKVKDEDQEFDLGLDVDGKTPLKLKRSQILELRKSGMLEADYRKKTSELAAEKATLKEVVDVIDFLKKNPKKAEKVMAILDEKEEKLEQQQQALEEKEDEIDKALKDLPEDDPYAKLLRGMKAQLQATLKANQALQDKLGKIEQGQQAEIQRRAKEGDEAKRNKELESGKQVLEEAFAGARKTFQFDEDEDAAQWRKRVINSLVEEKEKYAGMDKEKFTEFFNTVAKREFDAMQKEKEKIISMYLKSKGGSGHVPVGGTGGEKAKQKSEPVTMDNLQDKLEEALGEASENPGEEGS